MRLLMAIPIVALLAACGADGDPVRPNVSTGISVNSNGKVSTATSVSASSGNVTVAVGL
ncbi:hypothetical protein [Roseovarius sp. 2305UL8-3]|uniref:hypothetical protein n=1 Tax=Roseovarius conchicola TaxID=3121636 RepID=UPI0035290810